jgi:hypothetical protein
MLGDGGGSHQLAQGNRLVNPGQVGIGVAAGSEIRVLDNLIYASDELSWSNVGMYVWNQYESCGYVEVSGNQVNWTAGNAFWNGGGCDLDEHGNNWDANVGPSIWGGLSGQGRGVKVLEPERVKGTRAANALRQGLGAPRMAPATSQSAKCCTSWHRDAPTSRSPVTCSLGPKPSKPT